MIIAEYLTLKENSTFAPVN